MQVAVSRKTTVPPLRGFNQLVKFGYTIIERGQNDSVVNSAFETFDSFQECCTIAERCFAEKLLERVEIVPCQYDSERCHPQVMSVLKTLNGEEQPA